LLARTTEHSQKSGPFPWGETLLVNLGVFREAGIPLNSAIEKNAPLPRRPKKPIPTAIPEAPAPQPSVAFPIVGIGASAGGLEPLEQFLQWIAAGIGMAFVIVQRLDPTRKELMVNHLQRRTRMRIMQVKDRARFAPDCFHVIPAHLSHGRVIPHTISRRG